MKVKIRILHFSMIGYLQSSFHKSTHKEESIIDQFMERSNFIEANLFKGQENSFERREHSSYGGSSCRGFL